MAPNIIEGRFDSRIPLLLDLAITLAIFLHAGGGGFEDVLDDSFL